MRPTRNAPPAPARPRAAAFPSPPWDALVRPVLMVMGVVTALPALALIDLYALEWTYQVTDTTPMTAALLQHRGMLQALLGAALVWAAFSPAVRLGAAIAAVAGKSTFLALILPEPALRGDLALFSIVVDLACIVLLAGLAVGEIAARRRPARAAARG